MYIIVTRICHRGKAVMSFSPSLQFTKAPGDLWTGKGEEEYIFI